MAITVKDVELWEQRMQEHMGRRQQIAGEIKNLEEETEVLSCKINALLGFIQAGRKILQHEAL